MKRRFVGIFLLICYLGSSATYFLGCERSDREWAPPVCDNTTLRIAAFPGVAAVLAGGALIVAPIYIGALKIKQLLEGE